MSLPGGLMEGPSALEAELGARLGRIETRLDQIYSRVSSKVAPTPLSPCAVDGEAPVITLLTADSTSPITSRTVKIQSEHSSKHSSKEVPVSRVQSEPEVARSDSKCTGDSSKRAPATTTPAPEQERPSVPTGLMVPRKGGRGTLMLPDIAKQVNHRVSVRKQERASVFSHMSSVSHVSYASARMFQDGAEADGARSTSTASLVPSQPSSPAGGRPTAYRRSISGGGVASREGYSPHGNGWRHFTRREHQSMNLNRMTNIAQLVEVLPSRYVNEDSYFASVADFLDDPHSSAAAVFAHKVIEFLIVVSVFTAAARHVESLADAIAYTAVETTIEVLFLLEVMLRFACAPNRWLWIRSAFTWIDVLAVAPLLFRASVGFVSPEAGDKSEVGIVLLCIVPIIRLLKLLRHFETFRLLLNAYKICFEALPMLLYTMALINLSFSTAIYIAEPRDTIPTWQHAIWFVTVTMTTVGYGDVSPTTTAGYLITSVLIICSMLFMAVPIGIIGSTFQEVWSLRDRTLLIQRTQIALIKWGYSVQDIPALFQFIDNGGTGSIDVDQFTELLKEMKIGLSEDRIMTLFDYLNEDGSGKIDHKEFAKTIFPVAYLHYYGRESAAPTPTNKNQAPRKASMRSWSSFPASDAEEESDGNADSERGAS